ncbi:MAG TPA: hypothetical protein VHN37_13270 [Actinomycetota bacterium]|nr:hypothetical protein [Actinomycetota bacterium]
MPDPYELSSYEPLVGDVFRLEFADHPPVDLTLVDAAPGPWQRPEGGKTAFRLEFSGPAQPLLEQRTYRMEHAALGPVDLFIVPLAQDGERSTYEAVVN